MMPSRRRPGFTLIEALVASAVLSVVSLGIFRVFRSVNRQASQAAWLSASQKELRNGLKRVHDELSKASIYTRITPSAVQFLDPDDGTTAPNTDTEAGEADYMPNYFVQVNTDADESVTYQPNGADQRLLLWYQCTPQREGFAPEPFDPDNPPVLGYSAIVEVRLSGETLVLQRDDAHDPDGQNTDELIELIHNVVEVTTSRTDKDEVTGPLRGSEISMEVTVRHPNFAVFPNSRITQKISARVPVGFRGIQP